MEALTVDIPQIAFTKGNSMLIRTKVAANKTFTIAGSVPAVIDGSFMAEVYEGDRKIGEAYLNLPLAGAKGTATLRGHCLEGKPGGVYTVVIIPVALWLIEVYKASPVEVSKWRPIKEGGTEKFTYEIPDLKDMHRSPTPERTRCNHGKKQESILPLSSLYQRTGRKR